MARVLMGIDVAGYMADNKIGPIYQDGYSTLSDRQRSFYSKRQLAGQQRWAMDLELAINRLLRSDTVILVLDTDLKQKYRLMRKAVDTVPLNEYLTDLW